MNPIDQALKPWPYPGWIAHRGAGKLAPENTLAAFRCGARHGYRMYECDAKLSADGVVFLLHDDTLERTSNGHGVAGNQPWAALSQLDAGSWHSRRHAGEPLPTLEAVVRFCQANHHALNIEIKPTAGTELATGRAVAQAVLRLWNLPPAGDAPQTDRLVPPLLTSFQPEALVGAQAVAPGVRRGLLLESLWTGWLDMAVRLGCEAVICDQVLWDAATVAQVRQAGMRCLAYTVNEPGAAQRLLDLGLDGIITDRVDLFPPD